MIKRSARAGMARRCLRRFPRTGTASAIESPTTSASSTATNFGSSP